MTCYERVKLGEVATIRGGKRLPAGKDFTTTETAHPYIRARDIGGGAIRNLRRTRDLLLPRLLSGQLELAGTG